MLHTGRKTRNRQPGLGFRRPAPNSSLRPANLKLIDSLVRGAQPRLMLYGQPETIPIFIRLPEDLP
jgi:hypothetical protein